MAGPIACAATSRVTSQPTANSASAESPTDSPPGLCLDPRLVEDDADYCSKVHSIAAALSDRFAGLHLAVRLPDDSTTYESDFGSVVPAGFLFCNHEQSVAATRNPRVAYVCRTESFPSDDAVSAFAAATASAWNRCLGAERGWSSGDTTATFYAWVFARPPRPFDVAGCSIRTVDRRVDLVCEVGIAD